MSIYDICWCACNCPQRDCKRNIKFSTDFQQYKYQEYATISYLDENNPDKFHTDCQYKVSKDDFNNKEEI